MRNNKILYILLIGASMLLTACGKDSAYTGSSILGPGDSVSVFLDTLSLESQLLECSPIVSNPDSLMLGEMEMAYGTIRAELISQFACPEGFVYPETAELDSVCLLLYYGHHYGDGRSPLQIDVRELDLSTLYYDSIYSSDFRIDNYCSMAENTRVLNRKHIVVADSPSDSVSSNNGYMAAVRMRVRDDWAQNFFTNVRDFSSQEAFNDLFKGLYIYSDFGGSTVLSVHTCALCVYYHFSYNKAGRDTVVSDIKPFYANSEVRQVNRIRYLDNNLGSEEENMVELLSGDSTLNYIIAPAGVYTKVNIPLQGLMNEVEENIANRRVYVNKAELKVRVCNASVGAGSSSSRDDWAQPAENILLLRDYATRFFFAEKRLPEDTLAILGSLTQGTEENGDTYYYYRYDISSLLTLQLRDSDFIPNDTLAMVLMPVTVETAAATSSSSGSTTIGVKQAQTMSATVINSASRSDNPMSLEVIYSGF